MQCGISDGLPGFSYADADGKFSGIDVDVCRGVAAAVFGDDTKVKYTPLTAKERFTALQSGEVDLLSRNTTWTSSRDAGMGMAFTGVTYYDGIGFLTHDKAGLKSAKELDGATVCIQAGTDTELNVADYFKANNMKYASNLRSLRRISEGSGIGPLRYSGLGSITTVCPAHQIKQPN